MEDMRRHRRAWIVAGERLHPGEYAHRWPAVAVAFAVLRDTKLNVHPSAPGRNAVQIGHRCRSACRADG
ncbi:hypothetical protein DKT69_05970 [Micromonospora sicca]|uniref:Uncharacterized protein n=1 Tax=Micromonospora sicca TaxID=2202420 RepID=A0A317DNW9_9ACTN|nr:hypothetical protein DKT69_05970 [Micromonospora sp. 4G51]